jgi:hypothetical protein
MKRAVSLDLEEEKELDEGRDSHCSLFGWVGAVGGEQAMDYKLGARSTTY